MMWGPKIALCVAIVSPSLARAEVEISLYSGLQSAPTSDITIRGDDTIPDSDFSQVWEGQSLEWPIYGGFRITQWRSDSFGWGLDYAHNKTRPPEGELRPGFNALEFTDGLNTWTINAYRRWPDIFAGATPYVGGGLGLSAPGVEVRYNGIETFNYQITGPAVTWLAGVSYPLNDRWSLFGEYKGTYTQNRVDLIGGGTLDSDIVTNAINIGVTYAY